LHECTFADDLHCGSDHRRKRPHKLPDQIFKERTQASQDLGKSGDYTPADGRIKTLAPFVFGPRSGQIHHLREGQSRAPAVPAAPLWPPLSSRRTKPR